MSSIVKVDTIQENTSANGITVDGLNIKDSKLVTANSVVAANITADAIDATKIADNAISEEHLDVTAVTGHTAETSIADGDLVLIHDASASALRKMTKANFVSGIGGVMTPVFQVTLSGHQSLAINDVVTKITFDTEIIDSDGKFASNRFTPTVAGTYFISLGTASESNSAGIMNLSYSYIYKNGSAINGVTGRVDFRGNPGRGAGITTTVLVELDTDDYIEGYQAVNAASGTCRIMSWGTQMSGFKLIT